MTLPPLTEADYKIHNHAYWDAYAAHDASTVTDSLRAAARALHARLAERMAAEQPQPIDPGTAPAGSLIELRTQWRVQPDRTIGPRTSHPLWLLIEAPTTTPLAAYLRATLADHSALDLDATVAAIVAALDATSSPVSVEPKAVQS